MKNMAKLIGIIVIISIIGFSITACGGGGGNGGGATYSAWRFRITQSVFNDTFGPDNAFGVFVGHETPEWPTLYFITGNLSELKEAINSTEGNRSSPVIGNGLPFSGLGMFTSDTNALNRLQSNGYVLAFSSDGDDVRIVFIFKE